MRAEETAAGACRIPRRREAAGKYSGKWRTRPEKGRSTKEDGLRRNVAEGLRARSLLSRALPMAEAPEEAVRAGTTAAGACRIPRRREAAGKYSGKWRTRPENGRSTKEGELRRNVAEGLRARSLLFRALPMAEAPGEAVRAGGMTRGDKRSRALLSEAGSPAEAERAGEAVRGSRLPIPRTEPDQAARSRS